MSSCDNFDCQYMTLYGNCSLTACINHGQEQQIKITNVSKLRVPSGQKVHYIASEQGIMEVIDTLDQDGEVMYGTEKMVLSKEVFVAAYNAYIKDSEV